MLCFLIAFSSLSKFLLNCTKDCFTGLGSFLSFLAAWKSAISVLSSSYFRQSFVLCVVCGPPCFLQRLQCFLVQAFLGTLAVDLVPDLLFHFYPLLEASLVYCALDLFLAQTRSIALRDMRNQCMSTGIIPFMWRLNWSCHICGHIKRMIQPWQTVRSWELYWWAWRLGSRTSKAAAWCRSWAVLHTAQTDICWQAGASWAHLWCSTGPTQLCCWKTR